MPAIDFEPEAKIDFEPETTPRIDFEPEGASVAQMASATRATVGVVGRAIAAHDFAVAGYDAPDRSQLEDGYQPDESAMTNQAVAPAGTRRRAIQPLSPDFVLKPLLSLPRVTAQEVTDALSYLASASPDLTEEESEAVIAHTMKPGNLEKIVAGAQRAAISVPESMTSPLGIATLGTGLLPATAGRVVAGGFAVDMARHIPAQVRDLKAAIISGDSEKITEASGLLLASGAMTAAAGKHALTKPKTPLEQVAPLTAEAVAKVAPEPTQELKPGDPLRPEDIPLVEPKPAEPISPTPLTTEAVAKVVEKEPVIPSEEAFKVVDASAMEASELARWKSAQEELKDGKRITYVPAIKTKAGRVWMGESLSLKAESELLKDADLDQPYHHLLEEYIPESEMPGSTRGYFNTENGKFLTLMEVARERMEKEPVPPPAPTPAAVASESGPKPAPVPAGVEPPAKPSVTPAVTIGKPEGERTLTTEGDPSLTGIKNAKVDGERQSRGQEPILEPERLSNQTVWDRVMARIEAEPRWQDALIEELKTKPRTPSQDEILALDHRYVELKNGYDKAVAEGIKANEAGNPELAEAASRDAAIHEKWLGELEQVARNVGTEWGRSGQMRQRLLREDFTLAAMEAGARAKKGFEPLTPEEHSYFKELSEKHEAAEKKAAELEAAATEAAAALEAQKALTEAAKAAVPEYPPSVLAHAQRFVDFMHTKGDAARARIRERMARTYAAVDPTVLADAAIIGAEHLSAKALDVAKFTEAMVRDVGEWVREHAQEIFDASKKALTESENSFFKSADETTKKRVKKAAQTPTPTDARTSATEGLKESVAEGADGAEIGKYARAIAETFIKDGIRELEPLTDAVHGVLKTVLPEITRTESRDAWTNYGKYKLLDKDAVKVRLRELSTEGQKVSTIERLENKQPGLKTGTERQPPTDSARRMQKRINELKKELGIVTTDPSTQLRSALDAIKTRNQNRIKDLRFENSTRTRIVRGKRVAPSDAEVVAQRAEIDRLKKENEEIFGSKELTDEQRLQRAIAASERAEIAAEDRLARAENGDFSKVAGNPIPESGTLNEIRARTAALREETARLKDLATPKKTPDEIAIQSLKTRMASEKADLTRRLAEADFSPRRNPPRELTLDTPTAAARAEVLKLREEFRQRLAQYEYEQKSRMDKIWQGVKSARGAFVNIASSFDFSAPRQALLAILGNTTRLLTSPKRGAEMLARPFARMFESWSSERRAGIIEEKIKARPNAKNGADKIAEIHYSEINSTKFTRYEENAHSILDEWARLPLKTGNLAKTVTTAPLKLGARGVRASNRAFITFLNSTRAELFDELLRVNFNDRAPTSAELKVIGNMVNVATGRGKLGPRTTAAASSVIWAPSLLASRVQALTGQPLLTGQWAGSGRARLIVAKEYARWIAGGYLLWAVSRLFDDKDETKPTSSDFGKIVRGNTRIDPWGGLQQVTTLGARTATATTTSLRGKESDIGAARKYGQRGLWHVWADFGRSKLRPDIGVAIDIGTRATFRGEPTTPGHVAKSLLVPLPMREIVGILKDRGFTEGMIVEALGLFGAGVSNYEDSEAQK